MRNREVCEKLVAAGIALQDASYVDITEPNLSAMLLNSGSCALVAPTDTSICKCIHTKNIQRRMLNVRINHKACSPRAVNANLKPGSSF